MSELRRYVEMVQHGRRGCEECEAFMEPMHRGKWVKLEDVQNLLQDIERGHVSVNDAIEKNKND